jgi:Peptidase M66
LDFRPVIGIPVTVWIVKGPFAEQRQHAIEACIRTSAIWHNERMGVIFTPFKIIDATADPQAPSHYAFPNGDAGDVVWKPLRDDIGFVAGQLNIYWVDTVNGGTGNGWSNFGAQIAMGKNTGDELLSHETGHAFSLTHVDADTNFNTENIMHSASNSRQYATEGQLFRAHLNPASILNAVYNVRSGELTRFCDYSNAATSACPAIQKRLWADDGFPPN